MPFTVPDTSRNMGPLTTTENTHPREHESTLRLLLKERPLLLLGWSLFFFGIPLASTIASSIFMLIDLLIVLFRTNVLHQLVAGPPIHLELGHQKTRLAAILLALLILWACIGGIVSIRPDIALPSTIGLALVFILFFFRAGDLLWNDGWLLQRTMPLLVIGLLISGIYGVYATKVLGMTRLRLIGHGPNGSGTSLLISILLAWSYADLLTRSWLKVAVRLIALAAIPSLLFTFSRGAWLGFAGGVVCYMLVSKHKHKVGLVVGLLVVALLVGTNPKLQYRMQNIFSLERNRDRIEVWSTTIKLIPDHLLFGVGTAVFPHVYQQYSPRGNPMAFAHNFFLQALAEYGIPGFILLITVIGLCLVTGYSVVREHRWPLAAGVLSAVVGALIHQQVDNTIHGANLASVFWFLCGLLLTLDEVHQKSPRTKQKGKI